MYNKNFYLKMTHLYSASEIRKMNRTKCTELMKEIDPYYKETNPLLLKLKILLADKLKEKNLLTKYFSKMLERRLYRATAMMSIGGVHAFMSARGTAMPPFKSRKEITKYILFCDYHFNLPPSLRLLLDYARSSSIVGCKKLSTILDLIEYNYGWRKVDYTELKTIITNTLNSKSVTNIVEVCRRFYNSIYRDCIIYYETDELVVSTIINLFIYNDDVYN